MLIGIVSALYEEINLIKNDLAMDHKEMVGTREYYIGSLYGKDVVMVYSNCGKVSAATTLTILIERYHVDLVIFTGVAGGAEESLNVGDVVIASGLLQHDFDVSKLLNFPKYDNSLLGKSVFEIKEQYVALLNQIINDYLIEDFHSDIKPEILDRYQLTNPKVVSGIIASGDQFISDFDKIKELRDGIKNLKCVDMESASAAQICNEYNRDFIVFRIISDKADKNADISFDKFLNEVATIYSKGIIKKLLQQL